LQVLPYTPPSDAEDDWDAAVKNFMVELTASELNGAWTIGNELMAEGAAEGLADACTVGVWPQAFEQGPSVEVGTFTMIGLSATLAQNAPLQEAAFAFFDWWIGEEVAKRYISEAQSPMGLTEPITPELAGRLLSEFYATMEQVDSYFTTPASMTKVGDGWNAPIDAIKMLHATGDVEQAVEIWIQEMTPKA
jgi:ABC-type glycerol-3-phosphate transport system substrate-binding protein